MSHIRKIQKAKDTLKNAGYFVDDLWNITDVNKNYNCTNKESMTVLNAALTNEYIRQEINEAICSNAEALGFKKIQDFEGWTCTDLDNEQWGRKLYAGHYEFKEKNRNTSDEEELDEWIEIDIYLDRYTDSEIENHVSSYYGSLAELKEKCGESWEWILAECIFEQESGLY